MLTLALDLATVTGFALGDVNGIKVSGSRRMPSTGDDIGQFAEAFRDWLTKGLTRHKPARLVYEQPILPSETSLMTLRKLYGLTWQTELTARDLKKKGVLGPDFSVGEINMGDWIKHFLGAGNVPRDRPGRKAAVMQMCRVRGFHFDDDNEADALGVLDYDLACQSPASAIRATPLFAGVGPKPTAKMTVAEVRRKAAGLAK